MRGAATAAASGRWKSCQSVSTWKIEVAMREPPGVPMTMATWPSLSRIVGVMVDSGRLPGAIAFASPPTTPKMFGCAGLGGKVIHLVVEQEAGAHHHLAGTEVIVQCVGVRDRVAAGIGDGEVRGVVVRGKSGVHLAGRRATLRVHLRRAPRQVGRFEQRLPPAR